MSRAANLLAKIDEQLPHTTKQHARDLLQQHGPKKALTIARQKAKGKDAAHWHRVASHLENFKYTGKQP